MDMLQEDKRVTLSRAMMERWEIADTRPERAEAVMFGADRLMLGIAARLGKGIVCVSRSAAVLSAQDNMYTMLVRGEDENGSFIKREEVVQTILRSLDPQRDFEEIKALAADGDIRYIFMHAEADAVELGLAANLIAARIAKGMEMPFVCLFSELPAADAAQNSCAAVKKLALMGADAAVIESKILPGYFCAVLAEGLCGPMDPVERERAQRDMNYEDALLAWAEPYMRCTFEKTVAGLADAEDGYASVRALKARVWDTAVMMCACGGYLSGMDTAAEVMRDEDLRAWMGRAFNDEILPVIGREASAERVIKTFERLENASNNVRLMDAARGMVGNAKETFLPVVRVYADENFEAPRSLSLALAALIMLYAGVRSDTNGVYKIARGENADPISDDRAILAAFSTLAHDMPAESLTYAALADRELWGMDLREVDGLELRVATDISSIQRVGFRETLRLRLQAEKDS